MGIGGDGGEGEFGGVDFLGESSHRVRPALHPTQHLCIHTSNSLFPWVSRTRLLQRNSLKTPPVIALVAMSRALRIHTAYYSLSILAPRHRISSLRHPRFPRLGREGPRSTATRANNHPRDFGVTHFSLSPHVGVSFALLAVRHDPHGVLGDVGAGSRNGLGAVVAPADSALQATRKLHARVCRHAAVFGSFAHSLDLALHGFCELSVAELVATFGSLVCSAVSRRAPGGWL